MSAEMKIGTTTAKPGEISKGSLGYVTLADGSKTHVPIINVNGKGDGPVLTVVSGVHGPELTGIGALLGALENISPDEMRGALLAIPGANPLAVRRGVYVSSIDKVNLSGPWYLPPIDDDPTITQRLAGFINEAVDRADYLLDMHANPSPSMAFVITDLDLSVDKKTKEGTKNIARAFGVTSIDMPTKEAKSLRSICVKHGKPALTPELPGNILLQEEVMEIGKIGIINVMRELGMIDGDIQEQPVEVIPGDLR